MISQPMQSLQVWDRSGLVSVFVAVVLKLKIGPDSGFHGMTLLWLCERFFVEDGGAGHVWKWKRWI